MINIITRKGVTGLRAVLSAEREDGDHHRVWGRLSGAKQDTDFFISVSHQNQQGFPLSDDFEPTALQGQGLRENSDRERANLFANLGYRPNQDWQLGLTFNHTHGEQGVPPIVIDDNKDPFASRPRFERVDDLEGYSVQLAATFDPTVPWAARSWLYFNSLDQEENRYDDNQYNTITDRNNFHKENTNRVMGFHVQPSFEFGPEGLLSVAFDGRRESFDETGFIQTARNRSQPLAQDNEVFVYSAALEYSFKPLPKLGLIFSYGHHWQAREQGSSDNSNSFITGAYYDLSPQTRFRASVSRKVRVPSIRQLYESISGDPNLNFETAYLYEIGARYQFNSANSVDLVLSYTDVEDFIEKKPLNGSLRKQPGIPFPGH
ncbi:TonB-dependent receptor plug domain-containing protein [Nitrosococcus halophilus]|uniref:TonB-dependent receptor plug domain-containing protein n=1 Tax=Nitrosococcus halophilus TaxID=133539 RepID=UPI0002D26E3A|nr:TonB-dependent receptor [Nitrosococcus halophilus]